MAPRRKFQREHARTGVAGTLKTMAALEAMGDETRLLLKLAVRETAKVIRREVKANVPVGETGDLQRSVFRRSRHKGLTANIGVQQRYGRFIEFGTVQKPARPYLNPALESSAPGFRREVRDILRRRAPMAAARKGYHPK